MSAPQETKNPLAKTPYQERIFWQSSELLMSVPVVAHSSEVSISVSEAIQEDGISSTHTAGTARK